MSNYVSRFHTSVCRNTAHAPPTPAILLKCLVVSLRQAFFANGSYSLPYSKETLQASFDPCPAVGQGLWFVYEQAFWHIEVVQGQRVKK